ncbi:AbrB family transcriptional regulator [Celeribacter sp. PS-C1]|uniref:AbrB family transcriptional regulator n=1 Tax=Celeribacter sp. PS-C1 TaxID=2820813 RepID=UPI001C670079|nr:AbrB family transcriptional regulator [Celeribacter sp. PS-C1]MBW6419317.1 AbrB family transcriptional regulator [Celeribacter sp. PS-C1]
MTQVSNKTRATRNILTLLIGALGGTGFYIAGLPLPWMLGSMLAIFVCVMAGAPLETSGRFRPTVIPVIGVMLGSGFDTETFHHLSQWGLSLAGLSVYLVLAAVLVVPFYMKIGRLDPVTAFFSAMPGGLSEMTVIGSALGGDEKRIILAHAGRIVVTISIIALWFRVVLGYDVRGVPLHAEGESLTLFSGAILLACAVLGNLIGTKLKFPAPGLLGPMLLSGAVHMTGLTHSSPPGLLVIIAQVVLGTTMGCRFRGAKPKLVGEMLLLTLGGTLITMGLSLGFAMLLHGVFGQTMEQVLLAYAPGGLTEMSLVALAMHAEVAYISIHHLVRIVILVAVAPSLLTRVAERLKY